MHTSPSVNENIIELPLNSFVRRTDNTDSLKTLISANGGKLVRKGRSRNWRLFLPNTNKKALIDAIYQADQPSWLWLAKLLSEQTIEIGHETLVEIVRQNSAITISELISISGCTLAEARKAIDDAEWL